MLSQGCNYLRCRDSLIRLVIFATDIQSLRSHATAFILRRWASVGKQRKSQVDASDIGGGLASSVAGYLDVGMDSNWNRG